MSNWAFSVVAIIPAEMRDKANRLACAIGYDVMPGNTFSVPLSHDGQLPATHYACRSAAKQGFIDIVANAKDGIIPEIDWAAYNLTIDDVPLVIAALITDVKPADQNEGQIEATLSANGLMRIINE